MTAERTQAAIFSSGMVCGGRVLWRLSSMVSDVFLQDGRLSTVQDDSRVTRPHVYHGSDGDTQKGRAGMASQWRWLRLGTPVAVRK